jgi:hypothetical protein
MGFFRFFFCVLLLLMTSVSFAIDTDNDGLPDEWEVENGRDPLVADYQISITDKFACLLADGAITCWGDNQSGQLDAPQLDDIKQIETAYFMTTTYFSTGAVTVEGGVACALHSSNVTCWGSNEYGLLDVPQLTGPTKISLDEGIGCALDVNGIHCWGQHGSWGSPISYFDDTDFEGIIDIHLSRIYLLILDANGMHKIHLFNSSISPVLDGLNNPSMVDSGCILDNNEVICIGYDIGNSDITGVPHMNNPTYVSAGSLNACAVDDGSVKCWGQRPEFLNIPNLDEAYSLDVSRWVVCALETIGVQCWGSIESKILNSKIVPLMIDPDSDGVSSQGGEDRFPFDSTESYDSDNDGIGNNTDSDDDGDGVPDATDIYPLDARYFKDSDSDGLPDAFEEANGLNKYIPTDAQSDVDEDGLNALQEYLLGTSLISIDTDKDTLLDDWEIENGRDPLVADYQVSAGHEQTCAIDDSGVVCWGRGQINGNGPVLSNSTQISAGWNYACELNDLVVYCWGNNYDAYRYDAYTNAPVLSNPTQVSAGYSHTCAIDDTGVVCWGGWSSQISIPTLSNPTQVSVGYGHTCAIDDTGVVCWGSNEYGQADVPTLINPVQFSSGAYHTCAIDDAGVVCWGANWSGQISVPTLSNPTQVSAGYGHTCAIDDTGVVCWGSNEYGQADVPTLTNPVQFSSGAYHTCAIDDAGVVCWGNNNEGQVDVANILIDPDGDGFSSQWGQDVFPFDAAEWLDTDSDGVGNNTDFDDDGDTVLDSEDVFPYDGSEWIDSDNDGMGDNSDNCLLLANPDQFDTDSDSIGNACDKDDDGDGVLDSEDFFPLDGTEWVDSDQDGIGNNADTDDDNDGFADIFDALPLDASEQLDTDLDGIGNNADADDDGDGVEDGNDAFSVNGLYSSDTDSDGMPDAWEVLYGLNPNDPADIASDLDNDGIVALQEFYEGTAPGPEIEQNILSWDFDGNGSADALTDGLMMLRFAFGLTGVNVTNGAIADNSDMSSEEVLSNLNNAKDSLLTDIDGNGVVDALTDGLMLLRALFGLSGDNVITGAIGNEATRISATDVATYISDHMPN